jgi:hypothetical protein
LFLKKSPKNGQKESVMKKIALLVLAMIFLVSSNSFAGGRHGGQRSGGWGNPWVVVGAAVLTYGAVRTFYAPQRVIYTSPACETYGGNYYYNNNYNNSSYCNGSPDYCRGLAAAQRKRQMDFRRAEYQRGLRDGRGY